MATMNEPDGRPTTLEDARRWRTGAIAGWVTSGVLALALIPATCARERVGTSDVVGSNQTTILPSEGSRATGVSGVSLAESDLTLYRDRMKGLIDAGRIDVTLADGRTGFRFKGVSFFEPGKAQVSEPGQTALAEVLTGMGDIDNRIVYVEGHADDAPPNDTMYPSNWELGAARAASVAKALVAQGLSPQQVVVMSYGDTRPATTDGSATEEASANNRRVSLALMPAGARGTDQYSQK